MIRASSEPAKVAPPPAPEQPAGKFSYDRFGDAGKDETFQRPDHDLGGWSTIKVPGHWELQGFAAPKYAGDLAEVHVGRELQGVGSGVELDLRLGDARPGGEGEGDEGEAAHGQEGFGKPRATRRMACRAMRPEGLEPPTF